jgi:SAM-dependent methyltransferase
LVIGGRKAAACEAITSFGLCFTSVDFTHFSWDFIRSLCPSLCDFASLREIHWMDEQYTPGYSANATAFMAARSFGSHGEFIRPYLKPGMKVLDCGCGPGAISIGLAEAVGLDGHVTGIDFGELQIAVAKSRAAPKSHVPSGFSL